MQDIEEIWKDVDGFEKDYEISNLGKIRSKTRYLPYKNKSFLRLRKSKTLKLCIGTSGYPFLFLFKDSIPHNKSIHRLLMENFNPCENMKDLQVNHIDGNKLNYSLSNLEWCTKSENIQHSYKILNRDGVNKNRFGALNKLSKVTLQYDLNMNFIKEWSSIMDIQRELNFRASDIGTVARGEQKTAYGYIWKYKTKNTDNE